MNWQYHDGGREQAGFRGDAGDCVVRAIALATPRPPGTSPGQHYLDIYRSLQAEMKQPRCRRWFRGPASPRDGVPDRIWRPWLLARDWQWTPTMQVGSGCRVHLRTGELPPGRLIVQVSKHLCAVVDHVILDTHDPSRDGMRCVYGYWSQPDRKE